MKQQKKRSARVSSPLASPEKASGVYACLMCFNSLNYSGGSLRCQDCYDSDNLILIFAEPDASVQDMFVLSEWHGG